MSAMEVPSSPLPSPKPPHKVSPWALPILVLAVAYALLALTFTEQLSHQEIMQRCVLVDPSRARIWSVGNVEIGLAYLGVFGGMVFYFLRLYARSRRHLADLGLALAYLLGSFALDYFCVQNFHPFTALLVGDAVVMTFTVMVSRQMWFQRLLGVFVPVIFLTCGVGHFLEGLSYWQLTYTINTPWTMVTADIGFAVLVNASRFPAFIRGEDVVAELAVTKTRAENLQAEIDARMRAEAEKEAAQARVGTILRDVLASVTGGRLRLCHEESELPPMMGAPSDAIALTETDGLRELRRRTREAALSLGFSEGRWQDLMTAASECGMNAIVHAGGGLARVGTDGRGTIQVRVEDVGRGIAVEHLPRATLEKGYTTAGTLGQGMKMMLQAVDRVWLMTGPGGTTIVLEQERDQPLPSWM